MKSTGIYFSFFFFFLSAWKPAKITHIHWRSSSCLGCGRRRALCLLSRCLIDAVAKPVQVNRSQKGVGGYSTTPAQSATHPGKRLQSSPSPRGARVAALKGTCSGFMYKKKKKREKEEEKTSFQPPALMAAVQGWGEKRCSAAPGLSSTPADRL